MFQRGQCQVEKWNNPKQKPAIPRPEIAPSSTVRIWVAHFFGAQTDDKGGTLVRAIGLMRAKAKIGITTLAFNMRHLCHLGRLNPHPA
jgi:hypothetical protein